MSAHLAAFGRLVLEVVISIQAHSVTAGRAPMILASFGGREQRIAALASCLLAAAGHACHLIAPRHHSLIFQYVAPPTIMTAGPIAEHT